MTMALVNRNDCGPQRTERSPETIYCPPEVASTNLARQHGLVRTSRHWSVTYTIERYQEAASAFRSARSSEDKVFNGHIARIAEGNYCGFFGWSNLTNTPIRRFSRACPRNDMYALTCVSLTFTGVMATSWPRTGYSLICCTGWRCRGSTYCEDFASNAARISRCYSLMKPRLGQNGSTNDGQMFRTHTIGIREVDDQIWPVSFLEYHLGYFDKERDRVEPGPLTVHAGQSVNYVSGTRCKPCDRLTPMFVWW